MATTHKNLATSLQLGFDPADGSKDLILKTFTRINPEATDEAVRGAADDLSPLYKQEVAVVYRVDSYALQAA